MNYYVLSNSDHPVQLFFDITTATLIARDESTAYLDVFNPNGILIASKKMVDGEWSENF